MVIFPFAEYWWFYLSFVLFVLFMLALDLGIFHKKAREVSFRESLAWTSVWVGLALLFNYLFYLYLGQKLPNEPDLAKATALEFLTGFVVEKTLAIDNIFIFAAVFGYFGIPKVFQHRILFWGILGALLFRVLFIALGSTLLQYAWVGLFFGALLILTGIKMVFAGSGAEDLNKNMIVRALKKFLPISPKIEGDRFWLIKDGRFYVTPLLVALLFLEMSDIIFAIDSVPAIFAITKEPLIVFTSNVFAILGLRSMYFMLAGVMERFIYIKYGLAGVLVFVGFKMVYLNEAFGGKFPVLWSLGIIAGFIVSSILFSVFMEASRIQNERIDRVPMDSPIRLF